LRQPAAGNSQSLQVQSMRSQPKGPQYPIQLESIPLCSRFLGSTSFPCAIDKTNLAMANATSAINIYSDAMTVRYHAKDKTGCAIHKTNCATATATSAMNSYSGAMEAHYSAKPKIGCAISNNAGAKVKTDCAIAIILAAMNNNIAAIESPESFLITDMMNCERSQIMPGSPGR